jgi:two-component system, chemotaxis family, chemotaxis protein CheY
MKTLIVDDDFTSRLLLQEILKIYGPTYIAVNGKEAVAAVRTALEAAAPYDLVCLDIMMPGMNGHQALSEIRTLEAANGGISHRAKVVMTTGLGDRANVEEAIQEHCDYFLVKPIEKVTLLQELQKLALIDSSGHADTGSR